MAVLGPWRVGDIPTADIDVTITRDGDEVALDGYTDAEILFYNLDGTEVDWGAEPQIDTVNDVVTIPAPATSPFATDGVYTMYIRLTATGGGVETFLAALLRVVAISGGTWASIAQVYSIAGVEVTEQELNDAQMVVEMHCGRTAAGMGTDNTRLRDTDLGWLRKAVAYQAAWQRNQPGYLERHWVKEVIQDGTNIVYASSGEASNVAFLNLGPLAARAIKNLSWMKNRSIRLRTPTLGRTIGYIDYKSNDEHPGWMPM